LLLPAGVLFGGQYGAQTNNKEVLALDHVELKELIALREENAYLLQDNKRLRKQNEVLEEKLKDYVQVKEVSVGG